ncbi:hypothetical protein BLA29_014528 [Euroglyphus maynei]|uniref:Uncharacterized protein n=1 Tax=Euroglyphus maynei TaxID=6958 RepID=A0A1Y3B504_EURMA|nr:hypothetical protein BLA29_014528 [Euroglyphus maynei]
MKPMIVKPINLSIIITIITIIQLLKIINQQQ